MKWVPLEQTGDVPIARSSHSLDCVTSDTLVVWGGESSPRVPVAPADVYLYEIPSHRWTALPPAGGAAPCLRVAHAAAAIDSSLLIHGGRTEVREDSTLGDLWVFDIPTATWRELKPATGGAAAATPPARNYHAALSHDGSFYIFGGCGSGGRLADLWRYDPRGNEWHELPSSPMAGRGGPGFVAAAGALWVLGGFVGHEAGDIHRFDLAGGRWEEIVPSSGQEDAKVFSPRSVFACAALDVGAGSDSPRSCIVTFGGEIDPSDQGHAGAGQFSTATLCFDVGTRRWTEIPKIDGSDKTEPKARGWGAATVVPGRGMVVHGGIDDANVRLGDMYLLDIENV